MKLKKKTIKKLRRFLYNVLIMVESVINFIAASFLGFALPAFVWAALFSTGDPASAKNLTILGIAYVIYSLTLLIFLGAWRGLNGEE